MRLGGNIRFGFVPYRILGRYDGDLMALPSYCESKSIITFGTDAMRLVSGVYAPYIQQAAGLKRDLVITDDRKGTLFRLLYPYLRLLGYRVKVLDLCMDDEKRNIGILASVSDFREADSLAGQMTAEAGLLGTTEVCVRAFLASCFMLVKQMRRDASLKDALEYLKTGEAPDSTAEFNEQLIRFWARPKERELDHIRDNWKMLKEMSIRVLAPYAEAACLNSETVMDSFFSEKSTDTDGERIPEAVFFRPASKGSGISGVNSFVFRSICGQACGKDHPYGLSVFCIDPHVLQTPHLGEFIADTADHGVCYTLHAGSVSNLKDSSLINCAQILALTGTPDEATAEFLTERAGRFSLLGADISGRSNAIPVAAGYTSREELKTISKDEIYLIGSPDVPAWTHYPPDVIGDAPGLFKLTKLYYKDHAHGTDAVLDMDTGKAVRLTLDDFDSAREDRYEVVTGEGAARFGKTETEE